MKLDASDINNSYHLANRILVLVSNSVMASRSRELCEISGDEKAAPGTVVTLSSDKRTEVILVSDVDELLAHVEARPASAVVIDNREERQITSFSETLAGKSLPEILSRVSAARSLTRSAIVVILPESDVTPHHAYVVGSLQLGGVMVAPKSLGAALESVCRMVRKPERGKVALCLAGGGIEGMFYEIGVLRALNDHFVDKSVVDFDIFSGISAGAIISACLANGVYPQEIADALKGRPSRIDPVTRGMLFDPNFAEIATRLMGSLGDLLRGDWLKAPLDTAMRVTPNAVFSGDRLRWHMEKELSKPGMTNDFHKLNKELYVGATDQDTGTHVTFGDKGFRDMPISHAVRASCAMTPYYPPERIGGRFYIDGIFTRTLNLEVAVANGAKLIICVDPLTPVRTDEAGYVSGRGGFFNTVQSIKSMIRTRFSEVIGRAEEAYPNVTVIEFSPSPKDLEKMSGTLMRFFYRTETEEMAYTSTVERIRKDYPWLASDLGRHQFELRTPAK